MNRHRIRQSLPGLQPVLPAVLLALLCACGKQSDLPTPPHSPPKPVTYEPQAPAGDADRQSMPASTLMRFM
ncbi:hypothetical protein [Noviherbaspirillum massiliense]|uniref:hypothetical protein n=1 Tax=Noviherbaspirillum massiliense TaxID=1465823 RepID=UPI0002F199EF|nr:hypothetical protein [Noviherbaspirillum massiliense]